MKTKIAKVKAPTGFTFKIKRRDRYYVRVSLYSTVSTLEVGWIGLSLVRSGYYETHSTLAPQYRNQGLGALLYARAIQHCLEKGWRVQSSGASSDEAQRVWKGKTIRKYFSIRLKKDKANSSFDKWYAYAK